MTCVLLATYNGEKFLQEQLESLWSQSDQDFLLLVRDDRSTDGTMAILESWQKRYPDKIQIYENQTDAHGPAANFFGLCELAQSTGADTFLFCDQDDIWLPDKIQKLKKAKNGMAGPMLVHTDVSTIDEKGDLLAPSFVRSARIRPEGSLNALLVQNNATGCTFLFNRELLDIALQGKDKLTAIQMHDWWFALCAACFGEIRFLDEPTILYRQHSANSVGSAKNYDLKTWKKKVQKNLAPMEEMASFRTIQAFYDTYQNQLKKADMELLKGWTELPKKNKMGRMLWFLSHHVRAQNPWTTFFKWITI